MDEWVSSEKYQNLHSYIYEQILIMSKKIRLFVLSNILENILAIEHNFLDI